MSVTPLIHGFPRILDAKGRLVLPKPVLRWLDQQGVDEVVVTAGQDSCVAVYTPQKMLQVIQKIRDRSSRKEGSDEDSKTARFTERFLIENAAVCSVDKTGRIVVPRFLRERAGLRREVTVLGRVDFAEIWDPDRLQRQFEERGDKIESNLGGIG